MYAPSITLGSPVQFVFLDDDSQSRKHANANIAANRPQKPPSGMFNCEPPTAPTIALASSPNTHIAIVRPMTTFSPIQSSNGRGSCHHSTVGFSFFSVRRRISQPLALEASKRDVGPFHVIDAELGAGVLPEIELGQVAIKVLGIDVLINADDAALEDRKEPFEGVGVHVAAHPLEFGMVNRAVARRASKLENRRAIAHQPAALIQMLVKARADAAMVEHDGPDRAATLDKAENFHIAFATAGTLTGLSRTTHFHIVDLDSFAFATHRIKVATGGHRKANTVAKVPSGFHATAQGPLKLAGRVAFLAGAKQVDGLKPKPQAEVAILENGANADRKLLAAGVALAKAGAAGFAAQTPDLVASGLAMRADRAMRPKPGFDVLESGFLTVKMGGRKYRFSHDLPRFVEVNLAFVDGVVK